MDNLVFFRHPPDRISSFAIRVDISDVAAGVVLRPRNGDDRISLEILQRSQGDMVPAATIVGSWSAEADSYLLTITDAAGNVVYQISSRG